MYSINERIRFAIKELGVSQDSFAKGAHRTRSEISNIVYNKVVPKNEIIESICAAYKINEMWLRTGQGDPFCKMSAEEELSEIFANVLNGDPSTKSRLIRAFARLPEEAYPMIEQIVMNMAAELENKNAEQQ